ncbi:MAG: hypothetical protein GYA62_00685 [Bacteroidales bacterium]|nr:hypothetical protein [Bacteroidales bacterium]
MKRIAIAATNGVQKAPQEQIFDINLEILKADGLLKFEPICPLNGKYNIKILKNKDSQSGFYVDVQISCSYHEKETYTCKYPIKGNY